MTFESPITRSDLARALGCSRMTLWTYQRKGLLPAPTRINRRRSEFSPAAAMRAADLVEAARA